MSGMAEFTFKILKNIYKLYVIIILLNDYMIQQQFSVPNSAVHCVVKCTEIEEKTSQFKYKFKLGKRSDKIKVYNTVSSYTVDVQEVYNTGKCVKLYCGTLEGFLDEKDNVKFSLEISKIWMFITVSTKNHTNSKFCRAIIKIN